MIPFHVILRPGGIIYEQVVYAAKKAVISGQLRPGDSFPSVRTLSRELKINPNTAHKIVSQLVSSGLLEVRPGFGTVVTKPPQASKVEKARLLEEQFEALAVEGKRLGMELAEMQEALETHWRLLKSRRPLKIESSRGGPEK